jgi:16S rRNA (guanine966-N2)-methyltransferase
MADAGRVIAGSARGSRLAAPGEATRPLGDRVKQTMFAILEPHLPGANVLDLFAGSGAAGIEALSRGATRAVFVDRDATAQRTIEANLRSTHLAALGTVRRGDAVAYLGSTAPNDGPFDVVIVDPPYAKTEQLEAVLDVLGRAGTASLRPRPSPLLNPGAWVVVKHFWRDRPPAAVGLLASERARRFGETALTFYRLAGGPGPEA